MLTKNKKGLIGVDWFNFDPSIIGALSALTSYSLKKKKMR